MAAKSAAVSAPLDATVIGGRYRVVERLGKGGMGTVYRVVDDSTGRTLALKKLGVEHKKPRDAAAAQLRFRREFHTMASLRHPRVVEVYDYGLDDGEPYYTMELLDGQDLQDLGAIGPREACALLRDVAAALAFLHARRLLHRDVAPRNVRSTAEGRAKLIDFGVLATVGICGEVAGTPPFIAPENLRGLPLDHRADLFGLGALAYWLLCRRHAYPARKLEQLEEVWRRRPAAPGQIVAGLPEALDELVLALLSLDPLGRPATAAEVIDRLTAIGGLEPSPEAEAARGYLASAALVGRQREMQQVRRALAKVGDGQGRALLVEAPSGTGKSRLLRETGLEAQLAGATVVRATSDAAGRGPYGLFRELARELLAAAPEDAVEAALPRAPVLARVLPELRERLSARPLAPLGDPAEDRMLLQAELSAWVLEIARQRTLAILVDDVQRCDEASAAVLATLAHQAGGTRLLLALALRTDEAVRAPAAVAAMADAGQRLRLRGLGAEDVEALCKALFGDVPHLGRLAKWMHRMCGGSPLLCTELARSLVDRGVVRYVDGLWDVPSDGDELGHADLPQGLAEAMDARIAALTPAARALGEALSIHGGDLPLDVCVLLADTADEQAVFAALDELAFQEILVSAGEGAWHFRHDGLREALLRRTGADPERRRRLHLRVGEALAARGEEGPEREAEIGWHLLAGGETRRGAALLERAGRRLYEAQSFSDAVAPLEAALAAREAQGGSPRVRLELQHMLLMSGCMGDRAVAIRYARPTVDGFRRYAGVDVAASAGRFVGRLLGLAIGLAWATLRWIFTLPGRRGPNPFEAFRTFFVVVGYATAVHSLSFDIPRVRELVALVDPIAIFKKRVPYSVYLLTRNLLHIPLGDMATVKRNARQLLHILDTDRITPIRDMDRKTGGGGARFMLVLAAVADLDPSWTDELAKLAELKLRFYEVGALQARCLYHRLRGEEEQALAIGERAEAMFVQLGSVWQMESFLPVVSSMAYAFVRDVLGLKRTLEELGRLVRQGYHFQPFIDLARGEYFRERGDVAASLQALEPLATGEVGRAFPFIQLPGFAAYAESLLAAGEFERAKAMAAEGVRLGEDPERGNVHARGRSVRALALAEAAAGDLEGAARRLERALEEVAERKSPVLSGALHEARARVALAAGDYVTYELHRTDAERWFRPTRNPALIARLERLAEAGSPRVGRARLDPAALAPIEAPATVASAPHARKDAPGPAQPAAVQVVAAEAVTLPAPEDPRPWVSAVLSGCHGVAERAARALELVVHAAGGASGYLYLAQEGGGLALAAPAFGEEPPAALARALGEAAEALAEVTLAEVDWRPDGGAGPLPFQPVVLRVRGHVVGVAAVVAGALPLADPDPRLVEEIARELYEAGDVTRTESAKLTPTPLPAGAPKASD